MSAHLADTQDERDRKGGGHRWLTVTGPGRGPWMIGGGRSSYCSTARPNGPRSTGSWTPCAAASAARWCCAEGPGSGSRRCSSTPSPRHRTCGFAASPVSSRRSAWSSAACTSCWSLACRSWTTCRLRSGARCGSRSDRKQGRRRSGSWWDWRRLRCFPGRLKHSRCCALSMTRTGSIPNRRRCSVSSPGACARIASASSPASANRPHRRYSSSFRRSRWTAFPTPRRVSCSARWLAEPSTRKPSTASWPTPATTRSRWWNSAPSTRPTSSPAAPYSPNRSRWASGSRSTSCARYAACRQTPRRSRYWPRPTRAVTGPGCGARPPRPASTRMRPQPKRPEPVSWSSPATRCGSDIRCYGPRCITARMPLNAGRPTVCGAKKATRTCACGTWPRRRSSPTRNSRPNCSTRPNVRAPVAGTRPGPRCCGARPT